MSSHLESELEVIIQNGFQLGVPLNVFRPHHIAVGRLGGQHGLLNSRRLKEHADSKNEYAHACKASWIAERPPFTPTIEHRSRWQCIGPDRRIHIRERLNLPAGTNPVVSANSPAHDNYTPYLGQFIQIIFDPAKNSKK
jgi:hypothetical protein